ncbi:phenylacetate--CoA ligase family protein [Halodesulfovibrio aestuarii]|uniref:Phenylacetate-coenzyme A ligase n=1 Tax=Halodesulfovibrio aestuarii TaxID=126333 RepID=A0A8G2C9E7_9BACT|nr:phenylacetate--CoA ligase [Halodesulfovibrio aestuarii]SHJ08240.1 phenylacetate-CoA ligase [Halodesulfovibrio aestuarii]
MLYFDPAEGWSREEIEQAQVARLRATIAQARKAPIYCNRFDEMGITPDSIQSVDDVRKLPVTTKDDLRAQYPDKMNTVPRKDIVRMHASSGTTGSPTVIHYTQSDLDSWSDLVARCLHMVGVRPEHVFQNMTGYGLFTGGLGLHYGAERLGCLTMPSGPGNTKRQFMLMKDFNTYAAHIIPSYALYLGAALRDMGMAPEELPLGIVVTGAEPHTEEARQRIEKLLGVKAYNSYGLSEMNGPGVAFECTEQHGMHIWEDAFLPEIVDPVTLEPVADGEIGELIMTTLCRTGMPIIRYRTRDLTRFITDECPCGRQHRRIDRILGRADDMLIIKGVNIYPMQVERVLMEFSEVGENYVIELERENFIDQLRVKVEIKEEHFVEDMRVLQGLQRKIASRLCSEILITPRVEIVQHNSLPKSEGKAQRVVDKRE